MLALTVSGLIACLAAQAAVAQPKMVEPKRLGVPQGIAAASEVAPDDYILWRMVDDGNLKAARSRFEAMKKAYPKWTPPPDLVHILYPSAVASDRGPSASVKQSLDGAAFDNAGRGWSLYNAGRYKEAAAVFTRLEEPDANAAFGAALSFHQLQEEKAAASYADIAIRFAEEEGKDASSYEALLGDIRLAQAQSAYEAGDFEATLGFAHETPPSHARYDGAQRLAGWAALKAGHTDEARDIFTALYERSRREDDAQGLILAARALGEEKALAPSVADTDEPLALFLARGEGERAFYQKDFLRALRSRAPQAELLKGADKPWADAGVRIRRIDGVPGENRLFLTEETASAGASFGRNVVDVSMSALQLSSKDGNGSDGVIIPRIAWRREGDVDLAGLIGTTALSGPVGALPAGALGLRRTYASAEISAEVYGRPREESVLAFLGRFDPAMNAETGRVVAVGGDFKGRMQVHADWSLSGEIRGERLQGRNVVENTHWRAGLSLGRLFFRDRFDYFSAGPFVRVEGYGRNTNYYSFGHGGYFSPDLYLQSGLALNFRTPEVRRGILKLDAEISGEHVKNGDAFELPLTGTGAFLPGASSSGPSGSVSARYRRLIGESWIFGADLRLVRSAAYDDIEAGLVLRRVFGRRKVFVSRDFDPLSRRKALW